MVNWNKYIVSDPKIQQGKPVIKGTRITVDLIIEKLSEGEKHDQIIESHPHINEKMILACLSFAKDSLNNTEIYQLVS
ncbi:MAG: DUF433 domain-containing protein [Bacteroidales bacterium]|nr:DUF433 domain-containing protein [Bacteroidales bacterium]